MRQHHLTTTPGIAHKRHQQSWFGSSMRHLRSGGKIWQKVFSAILLLSMILLAPFGTVPVSAALGIPSLLAPANDVTITGVDAPPVGMPEFRWTEVTGAAKYRIQVSNCPTCFDTTSQTPVNAVTSNTNYTPFVGANMADGIWYWRVRADSPAPPGNYGEIRWFVKEWATPTNNPP